MSTQLVAQQGRLHALRQAVRVLTEADLARRLGRPYDYVKVMMAYQRARDGVATSPAEREDFDAQANVVIDNVITLQWLQLEPIAREPGGTAQRLIDDWADGLLTHPIRLLKAGVPTTGVSPYGMFLRHYAAHGLAVAALTGQPASVGFAGWGAPSPSSLLGAQILAAGVVADILSGVGPLVGNPCSCTSRLVDELARTLGVPAPSRGTLDEWLRELGREEDGWQFVWARDAVARGLVQTAQKCGLLDEEAQRLHREGRITIEPVPVAFALAGVTPSTPATVAEIERLAHAQAATAVVERYVGGGPVHATLALVGLSETYEDHDHYAVTDGATAWAAVLGPTVRDQAGTDVVTSRMAHANIDDEQLQGLPPEEARTERRYAWLAADVIAERWAEVREVARQILDEGQVDLPVCPPGERRGLGQTGQAHRGRGRTPTI